MATPTTAPPMARPRVAAGALFVDEQEQVLLVHPTYKDTWDIPGGYVEPGESPLAACRREVLEELSINAKVGSLLVLDWAPDDLGDKLLMVYDGGLLTSSDLSKLTLQADELDPCDFVQLAYLGRRVNRRLEKRLASAVMAKRRGVVFSLENGLVTA